MKCLLCNKESSFSGILLHVSKVHNLTSKQYYDLYFKKEHEGICSVCKKETGFGRFKYAIYCRGCSNKDPIVKEKKRLAFQKHYGCNSPLQCEEIKNKVNQTNLEVWGKKSPMQCEETIKKIEATNIKKRGVKNVMQDLDIKEKCTDSCFKNNGVVNPMFSEKIKERKDQKYLEKNGVKNPFQLDLVKEKIKQTNFKILQVENPSQSDNIKNKKIQTSIINYGKEYWSQTEEGKLFHRVQAIKQIENQKLNGEPLCPRIGFIERLCLNELEPFTPNKKIIRNNHDYAYIIGRFPDGEVVGLPLFIQYNERSHYLDKQTMKIENEDTIQTTLDLASNKDVGSKIVFNISEYDWKNNKEKTIYQFQTLIKELLNEQ
jgi:hypothetical protein